MEAFTKGKLDERHRAQQFVNDVKVPPKWTFSLTQGKLTELYWGWCQSRVEVGKGEWYRREGSRSRAGTNTTHSATQTFI